MGTQEGPEGCGKNRSPGRQLNKEPQTQLPLLFSWCEEQNPTRSPYLFLLQANNRVYSLHLQFYLARVRRHQNILTTTLRSKRPLSNQMVGLDR